MLKELKKELLADPQHIINILEEYEFSKVHIQSNEIRCGFAEGHNPSAIRIKLINNDNLFVSDYSRGINKDIISYIIETRGAEFAQVLSVIKSELCISDFYDFNTRRSVFGGFYDRIRNKAVTVNAKTYDESLLRDYLSAYNKRFLDDYIDFETQNKFNIGYDTVSQRITIPIYNSFGELIGVKGRANWDIAEDEPKYMYLIPCAMSSTLYGYCQNYPHLQNSDVYIFEAEKSVLQAYGYGYHNCVAIGSNSLSPTQSRLIMELNPKRVVFMLDKDLPYENTKRNYEQLKKYMAMSDTKVLWWDWTKNTTVPEKSSPSDCGIDVLKRIIDEELVGICQ